MNQLLPEDNVMMLLTSTYRIRQKEEEETEFENRYDWEMLFYVKSNQIDDIKLM